MSERRRDTQLTPRSLRRLLLPVVMLYLVGGLEGVEALRQRRRGTPRSLVTSRSDRDPASVRLLALTWWPAGIAALAAAAWLPQLDVGRRWRRPCLVGGVAMTAAGIGIRQWAIATLGQFFVGHVVVQPGQTVVSKGPYGRLRHPSYTGIWLEMVGVGVSTRNVLGMAVCLLLPLVGITARITGEERELSASLPGYGEYVRSRRRLVPFIW